METASESPVLLDVRDLRVVVAGASSEATVVDGVSFAIRAGEVVGLVGESGCGKSLTALAILKILPEGVARIAAGRVEFRGRDLVPIGERDMRAVRGAGIAMVFQEPLSALNPVMRVGDQVAEGILAHERVSRAAARARAVDWLRRVGIPSPESRARAYPHELSGGMRQRVLIASALACRPSLLLLDEPTTALDVTVQAQVLELLDRLRAELGIAILLITHDLGVVAGSASRVLVMYAGRIVEDSTARDLFREPKHPYTRALLDARPRVGERRGLRAIPGSVPDPFAFPSGCRFRPRCPLAAEPCAVEPALLEKDGRRVACHFA
ncbi:MAG: ABC transporter ATP-binding protein [Planctomycetes bacterium]|nr:ABC transporter ATP-binding protein [Planctomycetota bacterium]